MSTVVKRHISKLSEQPFISCNNMSLFVANQKLSLVLTSTRSIGVDEELLYHERLGL